MKATSGEVGPPMTYLISSRSMLGLPTDILYTSPVDAGFGEITNCFDFKLVG